MAGPESLEYQSEKEPPTRLDPELQQFGLFQTSPLVARRSELRSEEKAAVVLLRGHGQVFQ